MYMYLDTGMCHKQDGNSCFITLQIICPFELFPHLFSLNYGVYTVRDSTFAKYSLQCKAIHKNIFVCFAPTHQSQFG